MATKNDRSNKSEQAKQQSAARKAAQASRGSAKFAGKDKHNGASISQSGQQKR